MTRTEVKDGHDGHLDERRRAALWKWRWLGWRESTPAFKASLFLLGAVALALVAYVQVGR